MKIMKTIFVLFLSLILFGATSVLGADLDILSINSPSGNPGENVIVEISIENTNDAEQRTVIFESTVPTHVSNAEYTLSQPQIASVTLNPEETKDVQVTLALPSTLAGSYLATLTARDALDATNLDNQDYTVNVNPVANLEVSDLESGKEVIEGPEDSEKSVLFTLENTGSLSYNPVITVTGDFSDGDREVDFDVTEPGVLNPGNSKAITLVANIPDRMDLGVYTGSVEISTGHSSADTSFDLELYVEPEVCEDGRVSDGDTISGPRVGNVRVELNEPDDGDSFNMGENLEVKIEVANEDDKDLDIVVEAILYNIDQDEEVASVESDSEEVEEGKNKDFEVYLEIPVDEDLDEDDTYILYVKAYEDGDEDENCNYESVEVELDRNKHDVMVDLFTVTPSNPDCGDRVTFKVGVLNIGTSDQDNVYIKLFSSELDIDVTSDRFDLESYDEDDNDMLKTFTVSLPRNIDSGAYSVESIVFFKDTKESKSSFITVNVDSCEYDPGASGASITPARSSFSADQGDVLVIPFTVKNNEDSSKIYSIEVLATGWGESVYQQATLSAGQVAAINAYVSIDADASTGSQIAVINVKEGNNVLASESVTINVQGTDEGDEVTGGATYQPTTTWGSFWRNLGNSATALVVGVLILIALIVLLIVVIRR